MLKIGRNFIESEDAILRPASDYTSFAGFSCGDRDLDDFIQNDAEQYGRQLLAVTYSYHLKDNGTYLPPVAFVSLSNDRLQINSTRKSKKFVRAKHRKDYPAAKIGRLGVLKGMQGNSVGSSLIFLLKRLFITDNRTGCRFLTVDAYNNPRTINFYLKRDFLFLTQKDTDEPTRLMWFDLASFAE